jgi:hypothetical protein
MFLDKTLENKIIGIEIVIVNILDVMFLDKRLENKIIGIEIVILCFKFYVSR